MNGLIKGQRDFHELYILHIFSTLPDLSRSSQSLDRGGYIHFLSMSLAGQRVSENMSDIISGYLIDWSERILGALVIY